MGNELILVAVLELVRTLMRGAAELSKAAGIPEAELDKALDTAIAEFRVNRPENLSDFEE